MGMKGWFSKREIRDTYRQAAMTRKATTSRGVGIDEVRHKWGTCSIIRDLKSAGIYARICISTRDFIMSTNLPLTLHPPGEGHQTQETWRGSESLRHSGFSLLFSPQKVISDLAPPISGGLHFESSMDGFSGASPQAFPSNIHDPGYCKYSGYLSEQQ